MRRTFFCFLSLYILGCDFQAPCNSQWIEGDDGILYVQRIDKPETR